MILEKSGWINDFLNVITQDQRIEGFIYFNYDKSSEGEPNWSLNSDEGSLKVFQKLGEEPVKKPCIKLESVLSENYTKIFSFPTHTKPLSFLREGLLYVRSRPSTVTLPPAETTIACPAAVSHSHVGPERT